MSDEGAHPMTQNEIRQHFRELKQLNTCHSFSIFDARKYGVEEAILLHNLKFWIAKNKANEKHFHDGRTWTYNSQRAFAELFPYMSVSKIQRALAKLEKQGAILKGNYNKMRYDRTAWYALTDEEQLPSELVDAASPVQHAFCKTA
jgi:hypothetical protein